MPEPPTDLVYLSIGAISNHLHQFEYPSWILWGEKKKRQIRFRMKEKGSANVIIF